MVLNPIACPTCQHTEVVKHGKTSDGKQRFLCQNALCTQQTFLLEYVYKGKLPDVKQQIVDMTMNGSGIRDISRVLHISPTTVIDTLKNRFVALPRHLWWKKLESVGYLDVSGRSDRLLIGGADPVKKHGPGNLRM
jgi:transposase-like protein